VTDARLESWCEQEGRSPLLEACRGGCLEVVQWLVEVVRCDVTADEGDVVSDGTQ
jgi:hypothetical protein